MNKRIKIVLLVSVIILGLLIFFDNDSEFKKRSIDSNYQDNDNALYFYEYKSKIYYIDNNIPKDIIKTGDYKYCIEVDPRSYTDFRDYYLFKDILLVSGKYLQKYQCNSSKCYVISRDESSSIMDMNSVMTNKIITIYDDKYIYITLN